MDYIERYKNGKFEQVWDDLQSLGPSMRDDKFFSQAQAVATETMERVRRNCETIISRLSKMGYVFDRYPDGSRRNYSPEPISPPTSETHSDLLELETEAGPLPVSRPSRTANAFRSDVPVHLVPIYSTFLLICVFGFRFVSDSSPPPP